MKQFKSIAVLVGILLCGMFSYASPLVSTEKMEKAVCHAAHKTVERAIFKSAMTDPTFGTLSYELDHNTTVDLVVRTYWNGQWFADGQGDLYPGLMVNITVTGWKPHTGNYNETFDLPCEYTSYGTLTGQSLYTGTQRDFVPLLGTVTSVTYNSVEPLE